MNQQTTDKIRQIIIDYYGCQDVFTPASSLTGTIIDFDGDDVDTYNLAVMIELEFTIGLGDQYKDWQTVQDVFDSVEAAL